MWKTIDQFPLKKNLLEITLNITVVSRTRGRFVYPKSKIQGNAKENEGARNDSK